MQSQTYVQPLPSPLTIECQQQCIFVQGSSQYMDAVYSKFVKNFDKFDLYVRRNIVAVPASVADAVAARYAASKDTPATPHTKYNSSILEIHVASSVSLDEPKETEAEHELADLRHQLVMVAEKKQALEMEYREVTKKSTQLHGINEQLKSLHQLSQQALSPFRRTLNQLKTLRGSMKRIDTIQAALDDNIRERKRIKSEARESFEKMKKRFLTETAAVVFTSSKDLQTLHAKLVSM